MSRSEKADEKPPAELFLPASLLSQVYRKYARAVSEMERIAGSIIGSEVELCDYGPQGWAIRYKGVIYHDTQFDCAG